MAGRSRHGLHVVGDGDAPVPEPAPSALPGPDEAGSVSIRLSSVVLAVAGRLDARISGPLRMLLSVFTADGGPRELVLDLSDVSAIDGDGMAPILEAEEVLSLRAASLRLASVPAAFAQFLDDARCARMLGMDRPPITLRRVGSRPDDHPDRDQG